MPRLAVAVAIAASAAVIAPAALLIEPTAAQPAPAQCRRGTFKDFHNQGQGAPPAGYTGKVFKLSQDYPNVLPPEESYPWLKVPVNPDGSLTPANAEAYNNALRDYAYEGNIDHDWVVQDNPVRKWYDAPWMDVTGDGREFVHGLTHEIDASAENHTLGPQQKNNAQTWAVAHFNDRGGWAIGQMWCDPDKPDPDKLNPTAGHPNAMPNGTMIFKLLFSGASDEDAPFLRNSFPWTANIYAQTDHDPTDKDPARAMGQVRILQMDVSVRDDRLPTGWAFGTFMYNADAPGAGPFDRMVPLGIQWGNDPGLTPSMIEKEGRPLKEAWINRSPFATIPANHLGWGGRLAGPLDNPQSSCMSCHQTAGYPVEPILAEIARPPEFPWAPPEPAPVVAPDEVKLNWFLNVPAGVSWSGRQRYSLDYSLQLSMGLSRFYAARCQEQALEQEYSPRGEEQDSGREVALANCDELAAKVKDATESDDGGLQPWLVGLIVVVALGIGVLAGRRRSA